MERFVRARTPVIGATVMLALTGCTGTPTPSPNPVQQSPSPPASPTPSPSPTPTLTRDQQAAADVAVLFFRVQNQIASNADVPVSALNEVASGDLLAGSLVHFEEFRVDGRRQVGEAFPDVRAVAGDKSVFTIDICLDLTKVDIVDASGQSLVPEDNPPTVLHRVTVTEVGGRKLATADDALQVGC